MTTLEIKKAPCGCAKCWEDGMAAAKKAAASTPSNTLGARDLEEGMKGDDVKVIQELVLTEATGTYDAVTTRAVKVWQKHRGLTPTGLIGPYDWKRAAIDGEFDLAAR